MNNKFIFFLVVLLIAVIGTVVIFGRAETPIIDPSLNGDPAIVTMEESKQAAENWILTSSPTYTHDGSNLELLTEEEVIPGQRYSFVFSFTSSAAGYGDRSDEMAAQVITPHVMEVVIENGQVVRAVTDDVYDELVDEMIDETAVDEETTEALTIDLYFVRVVEGQEEVIAVEREIPYTVATARAAIQELLEGPTAEEAEAGLITSIPEGTQFQSVEIIDGTARVDFSQELDEDVAGSAAVTAIRNQIEMTLLQFETVDEVIISVNGETEAVLQP